MSLLVGGMPDIGFAHHCAHCKVRESFCKGLCPACYQRQRRREHPDLFRARDRKGYARKLEKAGSGYSRGVWLRLVSDPEKKLAERRRRANHKRLQKSGWTIDRFSKAWSIQGGACALCRTPFKTDSEACADHDHDTDLPKPRGLLCFNCNILEGFCRKYNYDPLFCGTLVVQYIKFYRVAAPDDIFVFGDP